MLEPGEDGDFVRWALAVSETAAFHGLPFLAYAVLGRRLRWSHKLLPILAVATLVVCDASYPLALRLGRLAVSVYGYFVPLVAGLFALRHQLVRVGRLPSLVGLWMACIWLSGSDYGSGHPMAVVVGWEVFLSTYSLIRRDGEHTAQRTLAQWMFFVFVNPTVVVAESGKPQSCRNVPSTILRLLGGLAVWSIQGVLLRWLLGDLARPGHMSATVRDDPAGLASAYPLAYVAYVLGHAGLASFRIGMMNLIGYHVPPCYRNPLIATCPADFWRRWNIWTRAWAERYLFLPLGRWLRKSFGLASPKHCVVGALLLSFLAMGVLHDATRYAMQPSGQQLSGRGVFLFGACGLWIVVWRGCHDWIRRSAMPLYQRAAAYPRGVSILAMGTVVYSHCILHAASFLLES